MFPLKKFDISAVLVVIFRLSFYIQTKCNPEALIDNRIISLKNAPYWASDYYSLLVTAVIFRKLIKNLGFQHCLSTDTIRETDVGKNIETAPDWFF